MIDRRRRLRAALLVLPVWVGALAFATLAAPAVNAASVTTATSCTNNAQAGTSSLPVTLSGDATPDPAVFGVDDVTLSGATFGIDVPGTVLLAGYSLGLLTTGVNNIPADVTLELLGANTTEGSQSVGPLSVTGVTTITDPTPANKTSGDETATPLAVSAALPTTTWTPAGGDVAISLGSSSTSALVGPGGIIIVTFVCTPGTPSPAGCGPAPATACTGTDPVPATPFTTVVVSGGSTTSSTSTTSTSTTSTTSTSTTSTSTTTSTTAPTSTTTSTVPPLEPTDVSGTGLYTTTCKNNVTPDVSELVFEVSGTTVAPIEAGQQVTLKDQSWTVTVPGSVLQTGINLGLLKAGDTPSGTAVVSVFADNTKEGEVTAKPVTIAVGPVQVSAGVAQPAKTTFAVPDMTWQAVGGNVTFAMSSASVEVELGPIAVAFTCTPKDPVATIVTASVRGETDIPPAKPAGPEVLNETVTAAAASAGETGTSGSTASATLPRTGASPLALLALAVGMIDLGYLFVTAVSPLRRSRRHAA
ncbi:hypothetical protein [Actinospongicola halichondriae]|uniref:hypothetical protein n=1 Tax=Actinospongicola halichondriae TaxID=3236844 RepID=UPI003D46CEC9